MHRHVPHPFSSLRRRTLRPIGPALLCGVLLFASAAPAIPAETEPALLSGKVIDRAGNPVEAALVTTGDAQIRTDAHGRFLLETSPGPIAITRAPFEDLTVEWSGTSDRLLVTLVPRIVRSLHVTGDTAADDARWDHLLDLADDTALNSVMIDLKAEGGRVYSPTPSGIADDLGTRSSISFDLAERTREAQERGHYVISRIVAFQDPVVARIRPEWSSWDTRTNAPYTRNGQTFLDPWDSGAREYVLTLGIDACRMGVDEVQFDYMRFLDGDKSAIRFDGPADAAGRTEAIRSFLEEARSELSPLGCAVAVDLFGFIVSKSHDGQIGQHLETLAPHVDVVSPMVYPSHYVSGWFDLSVPNDHPSIVVGSALDDAIPRLGDAPILRPWLQDFGYTASQVRAEIDEAEERDLGWMLWNARSNFTESAIPDAGAVAATLPPVPVVVEPLPASGFYDVPEDHVFAYDVGWMAAERITQGCNPPYDDEYCPALPVTREEMAAFLERAFDLPAGSATFSDVAVDSPFVASIAAIADAGITYGCNPPDDDRYCPDDDVTRGQMAAFLRRALDLPGEPTDFRDVAGDAAFGPAIGAIAEERITRGCNPPDNDRFCPSAPVTRGQMAAFLHRALGDRKP